MYLLLSMLVKNYDTVGGGGGIASHPSSARTEAGRLRLYNLNKACVLHTGEKGPRALEFLP